MKTAARILGDFVRRFVMFVGTIHIFLFIVFWPSEPPPDTIQFETVTASHGFVLVVAATFAFILVASDVIGDFIEDRLMRRRRLEEGS